MQNRKQNDTRTALGACTTSGLTNFQPPAAEVAGGAHFSSIAGSTISGTFRRFALHALAVSLLVLIAALPSLAATDTVTSLADDGVTAGSLRVVMANAAAGDTIVFSVTGTITLTRGYLEISKNLTLNGPGAAGLAISGNNASSVFYVDAGVTATLSGVTIEGGSASTGGGILNNGTLTVGNSTLSGNSATGATGAGGGIFNNGTLRVSNSTLSGNSASGATGGGGILNSGTLRVSNSTLAGNSAPSNEGGGIHNNGTLTLKSTLLAGQTGGGNCVGIGMTSNGYNLSDDTTCTFLTATGDQNNVTTAGLSPSGLQSNGGPTQTIALLTGSTALDAIPVNACTDAFGNLVTTDQRGVTRPQGAGCDIGAYELAQPVTANVCVAGHPAPCSSTITLDYYIPSGATLGANSVQVVTQGAPGLDFTLAGTTCNSALTVPGNCSVTVSFVPLAPGLRMGAVNLNNSSGNPVASTFISGTAVGSALAFTPGIITTVAGNYTLGGGYTGDGGPATSAQLEVPYGVAVDSSGNFYVADYDNNVIRKVSASGIITTVAGNYTLGGGYTGDGGPATSAELNNPSGVAVDSAGNLYIADSNNNVIRKVNASGIITTVAGNYTLGAGYNGDGGPATSAQLSMAGDNNASGVTVDNAGNLYIADTMNNVIRKVNAGGIITTMAGNGYGAGTAMGGYSGDGGPATSARLNNPYGVAVDSAGNLYIADSLNWVVRKVNTSGTIATVAGTGTTGYTGDGGPATSANLGHPFGVAVDSAGNLYIADPRYSVTRKVNAGGIITTVAGNSSWGFGGDNGPAPSAVFADPDGVAVDSAGNLYIADYYNNDIRKVNVTSSVLSFPLTDVGQTSSPQSMVVSDVGTAQLNFTIIPPATTAFVFSSNFQSASVAGTGCVAGTPLAVGADCNLGAEFAPTSQAAGSPNPLTGSITVTDDAFDSPQLVSLSGSYIGTTPYMLTTAANPPGGGTVSPASGNQTAGSVVSLKATPAAGYVFSNWTGSTVANPNSASTTITMTGPESVTANFISALTVSPYPSYNFGTVYLGSVTTENFTVSNTGTTPITITGSLISILQGGNASEFEDNNLCPESLAGGNHCTISVSFTAGPYYTPQTATLSIMDNAPGNPQTVTLTATVINPQASYNPTSLSFGTQTAKTSVAKTVQLTNTGATTLSITGMTVTGTGAAEFKLTPSSNCGSSLAAGSSCTINVTFKPVAKVSYSATLNVTDNAQSGTQKVPLSGTGH